MAIEVTVKRRPAVLASDISNALNQERIRWASEAVKYYELGVEDWKSKPIFLPVLIGGGDHDVVNIYAHGAVEAIYRQIDAGFQRQVEVTDDFMAKTQPGVLTSRPGRGGLKRGPDGQPLHLSSPAPVIPRQFTKQIADLIRQGYFDGMKAAFARVVRKSQ